ncbi:lipoprotein LpqH [Mycobacterium sp. NPDC048908]|uniref:lipoprotein LpqH n=1 Tax=Mycobacterium sp. NPDC048908 TaxID=3364292 RepID=UPI00371E0B4A
MARTSDRALASLTAVWLVAGLVGCQRGPDIVTSIVFDGAVRSITTSEVSCTKQPDGALVILVKAMPSQTVRAQLTEQGRIVVQKVGLRHGDWAGYVQDPREVTATKVDDSYTFTGRMPPNPGESQWHTFKIETTCPNYVDAPPPREPGLGAP